MSKIASIVLMWFGAILALFIYAIFEHMDQTVDLFRWKLSAVILLVWWIYKKYER